MLDLIAAARHCKVLYRCDGINSCLMRNCLALSVSLKLSCKERTRRGSMQARSSLPNGSSHRRAADVDQALRHSAPGTPGLKSCAAQAPAVGLARVTITRTPCALHLRCLLQLPDRQQPA